jgi:hypothetical protein
MDNSSHQDGQRQGQPDDKSNSGTPQNREDIISPGDSDNWPRILETLGVFIFGGFGVGLTEAGFHFGAFLCDFLAVGCGIGLVCHHIKKTRLIKRVWMLFWPLLFLDFFVFAFLLWHVEAGTEKSYPHITFSIRSPQMLENVVELTNDFLVVKNFKIEGTPPAKLLFPVTSQTNVVFILDVKNSGPVAAEYLEITLSVPEEFSCEPNSGWIPAEYGNSSFVENPAGVMVTNIIKSWVCKPLVLLPGNSITLPELHFSHVPLQPAGGTWNPPVCMVLARAKDSPAQAIWFESIFLLAPSNMPTIIPVVVKGKIIDGRDVFLIPPPRMIEPKK